MIAPLFDALESCVFDSQSVEMIDELERTEELEEISEELLETASEELDCVMLELETLLDDIALLELLSAEELLGLSELEEFGSLDEELAGEFIAAKFCIFPERSNPERTCRASLK